MEVSDKLPLKRVELSLSKFNEVAIPHHLDLLRQHKANIIKYSELCDYARVRVEQTHARRVSSQLRALLGELDALRRRVREADLPAFDASTQRARDHTLKAIVEYLETSPLAINRRPEPVAVAGSTASTTSTESVGVVHAALPGGLTVQLHHEDEPSLEEREQVLRGWSALQTEVRALHDAWHAVHAAALTQRQQVSVTATNVEAAADNVATARKDLAIAAKLRVGAYSMGGAALGALVGGPAGLLAGAKAGAAAALAGSVLGYFTARAIGRPPPPPTPPTPPTDREMTSKKDD